MARFQQLGRALILAVAGAAVMMLAGCSDYNGSLPKHMRPLDAKTRKLVERKGMELRSPILVRIYKEEAKLEVWKQQRASGRYIFLKDYDICAWSGVLGPKIKEGDRQAPEGFYTIRPAQMNPDSNYYLAFNMGYPNAFDRALGRTGSELMVHGACSSRGCYSMTDESIQEIYTLGRLAFQGGQRDFQVQAFPFRMTPENMAKHRNDPNMPFWMMLKEGYDHFEIAGQPPQVDVCDRRYIFNATPANGGGFIPGGACPAMSMSEPLRAALEQKEARDNAKMMLIAQKLDQREGGDGVAALQLALATPTSADRASPMPMSVATAPVSLEPQTTASVATSMPETEAQPTASAPAPVVANAAPAPVPRPAPAAAAPAPAPSATASNSAFLPMPELRTAETGAPTPPPAAQPGNASSQAATLEERMLVGSTPPAEGVANSYATATTQDDGLTGMVLQLIRKGEDAETN